MEWNKVSPFAFLRLFTADASTPSAKTLRTLALAAGLQCIPEGKNISDLNQVYMAEDIGFGASQRTNWLMSFGLSMIGGGRLAKALLARLGPRLFTTLANVSTAAAFTLWAGVPRGWAMWLGLLLLLPGMERRAALGSLAVDHASACGMGRGEYAAAFANWRALMVVSAPLLYGKVYAWSSAVRKGKGRGSGGPAPGVAYLVGVAAVAAAEVLHRSMPDAELFRLRKKSKG